MSILYNSALKTDSNSPADTARLARLSASLLQGGEIIFLRGPIGSGKTFFVREMVRSLGAGVLPVSASFALCRHYRGKRLGLWHLDLFRLSTTETADLGLEDILSNPGDIIAVEWPQAAENYFSADRIEIAIALKRSDRRGIIIKSSGPLSARFLAGLREKLAKNGLKFPQPRPKRQNGK